MAGYLVLARKYRSATFDEVVGQEPIAKTLTNAIRTGRLAHAYLFTGTRGVGKTTMARILAKAMNCLSAEGPTAEPCNECDACISISRGDDIDVVEIDGASNRGIDEIRELRANAILRPARSRFKIYYIDEVHMLTREAFNALLKTLEEPPEHVKFIFSTTEVQKVPATILSRCQRFDFRNIPTRLIAEHLAKICKAEKVKADDDALFRVARAAGGSMRDALSLLDQLLAAGAEKITDADVVAALGTPSDERMMAIAGAIARGDAAAALSELDTVLDSGVTLPTAAEALGHVFRNMMLAAVCGGDSNLIELPESQRNGVAQLAERFDVPVLVQAVGMLQAAARNVKTGSLGRALLEAVVIRLADAEKFLSPEVLLERIEQAEQSQPGSSSAAKKKVPVAPARTGAADSAPCQRLISPTAEPARRAVDVEIQWEASWLAENWQVLIESLVARRQMKVAGLLQPARVVGFENDVLSLAYPSAHEALGDRCRGPMRQAVCSALTQLAGRPVSFEVVSDGEAPSGGSSSQTRPAVLSTAEKNEIYNDPAVQTVLELFGGQVVDMQKTMEPDGRMQEQQEQ